MRMWHRPREHQRGSDASCASHRSLLTAAVQKGWGRALGHGREGLCCLGLLGSERVEFLLLAAVPLRRCWRLFVCFLKTQDVANKTPELGEAGPVLSPAMASRNVLHLPSVYSALVLSQPLSRHFKA